MTRALYRPQCERTGRPPNPFVEEAFEELATRPNEHEYDYDALTFRGEPSYDPLPIGVHVYGQDNWGALLPAPAHGPAQTYRGWYGR